MYTLRLSLVDDRSSFFGNRSSIVGNRSSFVGNRSSFVGNCGKFSSLLLNGCYHTPPHSREEPLLRGVAFILQRARSPFTLHLDKHTLRLLSIYFSIMLPIRKKFIRKWNSNDQNLKKILRNSKDSSSKFQCSVCQKSIVPHSCIWKVKD